jgi:hypothetical protein
MGSFCARQQRELQVEVELKDLTTRPLAGVLTRHFTRRIPFEVQRIIERIDQGHKDLWEIILLVDDPLHKNEQEMDPARRRHMEFLRALRDISYHENPKFRGFSDKDWTVSFDDLCPEIRQLLSILQYMNIARDPRV